jgi:hypothetical protein
MGKKDKPKEEVESFWTVLISEVRIQKGRYRVKGHFAYVTLRIVSGNKRLSFSWLTPEDEPFEFDLPPFLFPGKRFDKIAPLDVERRFIELFDRVPVATVPEAPISLPLEKLPPRKRRRALQVARKKREKSIWNPPSVD